MGQVRLPRFGRRGHVDVLKLVTSVRGEGDTGFQWLGGFRQPGGWIDVEEVSQCIVLETTVVPGPHAERVRRRHEVLHLLWQWDPRAGDWRELAPTQGLRQDSLRDLAPIARRALRQGMVIVRPPCEVACRLREHFDRELAALDPPDRTAALALLHDEIAARLTGAAG